MLVFGEDNSKCLLSLVLRSVMLHDLWCTDISPGLDHFEDYQNIHKIQGKLVIMNGGNPEALETLYRNPLSCFPPIWRPHVIHFLETKSHPLRVAKTNIDRRGSSDAECCEEIFCRAEICFFNCKSSDLFSVRFGETSRGCCKIKGANSFLYANVVISKAVNRWIPGAIFFGVTQVVRWSHSIS